MYTERGEIKKEGEEWQLDGTEKETRGKIERERLAE